MLGNQTVSGATFTDFGNGVYSESTVSFQDARNEFTTRPGTERADKRKTCGLIRRLEGENTDGERVETYVSVNIVAGHDENHDAALLATLVAQAGEFLTAANIDKLMSGSY